MKEEIKSRNFQLLLERVFHFFDVHGNILLFIVLLFFIYWTNTFHTNFPDEFDNIVGGWYILQGKLPYIGFFSHHNPGAYFLSSVIMLFSGRSLVQFRIWWAVVLFGSAVIGWWFLGKLVGHKEMKFYGGFLLLVAVSATYYWGHMMLSETVVAYTLIPAYILVFLKTLRQLQIHLGDLFFISILIFITLFTSFTFIIASLILVVSVIFRFLFQELPKRDKLMSLISRDSRIKIIQVVLIFGLPYLIFLIYLLLTGSYSEFIFQSIVYNREYYIYNFPKVAGQISTNPFRYAISIFYNTSIQFHSLLVQIRNFNLSYPVNITLLLANVAILVYLLTKRKFLLSIMVYTFLIYLNARGEPLSSGETDFHSTVYIMVSLFHLIFFLKVVFTDLNEKIHKGVKSIYQFLLVIVGIYSFFLILFLVRSWGEKVYARFMGNAPGIYDAPVAAPIINRIVTYDEYFWIGPFELQELLYINGKLPSKYHWFLPANARSDKIKQEITRDLLMHRPKLIVFKEDYATFGVTPEDFNSTIVNILRTHYFRISDLRTEGEAYKMLITNLRNFDIEQNFYFAKDRKQEMIELLLKVGIIEKAV